MENIYFLLIPHLSKEKTRQKHNNEFLCYFLLLIDYKLIIYRDNFWLMINY